LVKLTAALRYAGCFQFTLLIGLFSKVIMVASETKIKENIEKLFPCTKYQ
jgi:hypothetical protein